MENKMPACLPPTSSSWQGLRKRRDRAEF